MKGQDLDSGILLSCLLAICTLLGVTGHTL